MNSGTARLVHRARQFGLGYRTMILLTVLSLGAAIFEVIGLGLFLPIVQYLQAGGALEKLAADHRYWHWLIVGAKFVGLNINLAVLLSLGMACVLIMQIFTYFRVFIEERTRYNARYESVCDMLRIFLTTKMRYHDDVMVGQVINNITLELPRAIDGVFRAATLASQVILIFVYVLSLLLVATWMTLITIAVIAFSVLIVRRFLIQTTKTSRDLIKDNGNVGAFLVERLRSVRLIRLSGTEKHEVKSLEELTARQRDGSIRLQLLASRLRLASEPSAILIATAIFYVGYTVYDMSLGLIGLFFLVLMRLLPISQAATKTYQQVLIHLASFDSVDRLLTSLAEAREPTGGSESFQTVRKHIRLQNVSYSYGPSTPALVDVTCELSAQRITALVGPSGSGKSTLIDLLPRLRDPTHGKILVDDVDLAAFTVSSLRAGIAFVPQQPQIFNATAAEHIRYGREDATDADIREAAQLAGADEFILRLPQGYETMLGEGGGRLSGGQRQRLDLARALVGRSSILIFDEPTSQLDAESEHQFRLALRRIRAKTYSTIVIVGHRLSTVSEADLIIVLEQGSVTEKGSHPELMRRGGWYAKAFAKQNGDGSVNVAVPTQLAG